MSEDNLKNAFRWIDFCEWVAKWWNRSVQGSLLVGTLLVVYMFADKELKSDFARHLLFFKPVDGVPIWYSPGFYLVYGNLVPLAIGAFFKSSSSASQRREEQRVRSQIARYKGKLGAPQGGQLDALGREKSELQRKLTGQPLSSGRDPRSLQERSKKRLGKTKTGTKKPSKKKPR